MTEPFGKWRCAMETKGAGERKIDDIGSYLGREHCGETRVWQLLEGKGREVCVIAPRDSVLEALQRMGECAIGALVVMEDGSVAGIISERDYARKVILTGKGSSDTQVGEIMSSPVCTVTPDMTVAECMELMTDRYIRHLPVLDGDQLAGIVSIGDLVKSIISDQEKRIEQFERYITGSYPT
jgi:CBS domain-containing protein